MKNASGGQESSPETGRTDDPAAPVAGSGRTGLAAKQHLLISGTFFFESCCCLAGLAGVAWFFPAPPAWSAGILPPRLDVFLCITALGLLWQHCLRLSGGYAPSLPRSPDDLLRRMVPRLLGSLLVWLLVLLWLGVDASGTLRLGLAAGGWGLIWYVLLLPRLRFVLLVWFVRRGLRERVLFLGDDAWIERVQQAYPLLVEPAVGIDAAGGISDPEALLRQLVRERIDRILCGDRADAGLVKHIAMIAAIAGVSACTVQWRGSDADAPEICELVSFPRTPGKLLWKEICDVIGALGVLLLCWPLLLVAALAVRLTSAGPILFRQERMGRRGRVFHMFKFRSMRLGADQDHAGLAAMEPGDILFKPERDPRVTPVGRILRRTSLDELPQLWNILVGDMSLVGPRPMPLYETAVLPPDVLLRRHAMKPGLTGLWQVSGRSNIRSLDERTELDLAYIDQWSPALDLVILLKTIPAVLTARGAQ